MFDFSIQGYIGGAQANADTVARQLAKRWGRPVSVELNSSGGSLFDGLRICGLLSQHGNVTVHIAQWAASAATIAAMGARRIVAAPTSLVLVHNVATPVCLTNYYNKEQLAAIIASLRSQAADLATLDGVVTSLYAQRTGQPADKLASLMRRARWMTAPQAKAYGLVDEIEAPPPPSP